MGKLAGKVPGQLLFLALAITLFSLASPLIKWLIRHGGELGLSHPGAISFCNVLFVGNLAAGLLVAGMFGLSGLRRDLAQLTGMQHVRLFVGMVLAAAIPALLFIALETTTVTNVVLLSRFEAVVFAILSVVLLNQRLQLSQAMGLTIIAVGILGLVLLESDFHLMSGDGLTLLSAVLHAGAAVLGKKLLENLSVRAFVFARNLGSSILFFVVAIYLYGFEHFMDAFAASLWIPMVIYALVIIVVGQFAWYRALAKLPPATVANWSMSSPFLGILFAFLLLQEVPTGAQWIAGAIILVGMVVTRLGPRREGEVVPAPEQSLAAAEGMPRTRSARLQEG
jgi:drug/metabolite transporter (DMT)-like permease